MASGRVSKVKGKVLDIPANAPTIGTATDPGTGGAASVAFTAPSTSVGGPIFSYTAISNPGSITGTGTSSPIAVSGLTNGTAYTFTVAGTNPTGSGPYSAASNSLTPAAPLAYYESIQTVTVGSTAQSTISFTSIPQTFTHLQIRGIARDSASAAYSYFGIRFNSDTGSNYRDHYLFGNGSTRGAGSNSLTFVENDGIPGNTATANVFGAIVIDILEYKSTSKLKVIKALVGNDRNGSGEIYSNSGLYFATPAAITSISLIAQSGSGAFQQYSSFALYGIKGA